MLKDEITFGRYNIYTILIETFKEYTGTREYYELENYLAKKLNCDCTDCGGKDISRKCNVEKYFFKRYSYVKQNTLV